MPRPNALRPATPAEEAQRMADARAFAGECARLCEQTRCNNVAVLDVSAISPITDFLVLATGTSGRQMKTVVDDLADMAHAKNQQSMGGETTESESWMLIDFVDVVVHVFTPESRAFYDLDNLWGDAKPVEWKIVSVPPTAPSRT